MPLDQQKLTSKAQKINKTMQGLETETLTRINRVYAQAFQQLLKRLPAEYAKLESRKASLGIFRVKKLLEDLGEYMTVLQPEQIPYVQKQLEELYLKASEWGVNWADEQFSQMTQETGLEFVKSSLSDKVNLEAARFAATNSVERLKNYSEDFRVETANIVALNLTLGVGAAKTAAQLRQRFGILKGKAETIARTETLAALNDATDFRYQENDIEYVQFIATSDADTCPYCLGRNQSIYKRGEVKAPLHPRCFPTGTVVEGLKAESASRRYYCGKVVTIKTASGKELTATPNHPILSSEGWVSIKHLRNGHHVISTISSQGVADVINPDTYQAPAFIEDIFASLRKSSGMVSTTMPVSPKHFHNDFGLVQSNVNIIHPYSFLDSITNLSFSQPVTHELFTTTPKFSGVFSAFCLLAFSLPLYHFTPCSIMRRCSKFFPFFRSHFTKSNKICLCSTSRSNTVFNQPSSYRSSSNSKFFTERLLTLSPYVFADEVIDVNITSFVGHVFNFETSEEWYIANSIIVHNCRCFLQAIPDIDWIDNGTLDKDYSRQYYEKAKGDRPITRTQPAPFEKVAGVTTAPKAIWTPT